MMRILKYTAALAAVAFFAACSDDPADPTEETQHPQDSDLPICWNVKEVAAPGSVTRALIGNDREETDPEGSTDPTNPNYFLPLTTACSTDLATDPLKEKKFAVGLFGDYSYVENGNTVKVYDLYRGARLVYLPEVEIDKNKKVLSKWDTNVAMKYWHPGAKYIFRAYYPQRLHGYTISTSNATTLAMTYPSRKLQYDLLLGYANVEATPGEDGQMRNPVDLQMHHALAALRFEFQLDFDDVDWLTSVYLHNDEERHYFSQGTVTYGTEEHLDNLVWLEDYNPPATEDLYKWVPPAKYWGGKTNVDPDGKTVAELEKELEGKTSDELKENPVLMWTAPIATESGPQYDHQTARGYSIGAVGDQAVEGDIFAHNSSWLLIVPQESYGKLTLCFTTKKGGEGVYKVTLPKETGTKIEVKDSEGNVMKDSEGNVIKKDAWVAGMRYTYLVTLSQSDLKLEVSVKPWNERKHSTEIIF